MKIIDCHNDFLTHFKTRQEKINYVKSLNNVKLLCCAVFTTEQHLGLKELYRLKNELYILQTYTKTKLFYTIEDIGFVDNVEKLNRLIEIKPFAVTLGWNFNNCLCGGALDDGDLTEWGKRVVKELENNNIYVDVAHMNEKSFYSFAKITKMPIFCSHANLNSLFEHKRNLTDKQIKVIVESNGFLGLTVYQKFISNKEISCNDISKQFKYLTDKFGYKNFGFGTDFCGFNSKFSPYDFINYSQFNNIKNALTQKGFNNKIIKNISYKNFIRNIKSQHV